MSISSEITRISTAKSDIADAIEYKGVTVPSSTKIDGYATLIRQIQGGGNIIVNETQDSHGGTVVEITTTTDPIRFQEKSATPTTSSQTVSPDTGYNGLSRVVVNPIPSQYIIPTGTKSISENGTGIDVTQYAAVDVTVPTGIDFPTFTIAFGQGEMEILSVTCDKTYAECRTYLANEVYYANAILTFGSDTYQDILTISVYSDNNITYTLLHVDGPVLDVFYNSSGSITSALPSTYYKVLNATENGTYHPQPGTYGEVNINVPTGTPRTSSDLTVSGATVTVPAGLYASGASASVASGVAGTPTVTTSISQEGHYVHVTPRVVNQSGYISGGTINGNLIQINASQLVSGTKNISANGNGIDVADYASVNVNVPINLQAKTVTPSLSNQVITADSPTVLTSLNSAEHGNYYSGTTRWSLTWSSLPVSGNTYHITLSGERAYRNRTYSYNGDIEFTSFPITISPTVSPQGYGTETFRIYQDYVEHNVSMDDETTFFISMSFATGSVSYDGLSQVTVYAMPSGTAGTPTATKGTVSNHSVMVVPSVTNVTGYITGGQVVGIGVSVSASELVSGTKSIAANGTGIDVTNYAEVDVSVTPSLEAKTGVTPTESSQTVSPSTGYDGLSSVQIDAISSSYVGSGIARRSSSDLTANLNTVTVPSGYYASSASKTITEVAAARPTISLNSSTGVVTASVDQDTGFVVGGIDTASLSLTTQNGSTITPTETEQTAVGAEKYTLGDVKVGAISSTYVGSGITRRSSSDLTASGATVSVPSGYYASNASKAVASGSASTPATTVTANPSISVSSSGLITATASATKSVTPTVSAGYVSSGTAGTITVSGSNTSQLSTQAATTITPTKSSQTAVAAGKYTTGAVTVAAIPAAYQDVTGVTATASDVVSGKDFVNSSGTVVHGSLVIQHYYTGSGAPSSSLGVNGDIYLQTS